MRLLALGLTGLLAFFALCLAPSSLAATGTGSAPQVEIDRSLFYSTVPSYASVGQNYTVKVMVTSNSNVTVPVLIRLEAPVDAFYIHPFLVEGSVSPHGSLLANFSLIPFGSSFRGTLNVTAVVSIWALNSMSRPQTVDSASLIVGSIRPQVAGQVTLVLSGLVVLAFLVVVSVVVVKQRGGPQPAQGGSESQSFRVAPRRLDSKGTFERQ